MGTYWCDVPMRHLRQITAPPLQQQRAAYDTQTGISQEGASKRSQMRTSVRLGF